jgi:hypothetical protein
MSYAHERRQLWKLKVWFPGHCGSSPSTSDYWYAAETISAVMDAHRAEYKSSMIMGIENFGYVNIPGGGAPAQETKP